MMSETEVLDHAEEERLAVFAKYDKGREEGAKIDDWEDPGLEIYHVSDRYGFIHDRVVPRLKAEEKRANLEAERSEKWLKMLPRDHRSTKFLSSDKLKRRVYKGIPNKLRCTVWALLLDLRTIKEQQKGKYDEMYELARKYSPDVRQIDLDVNRTYRDTITFRKRYGKEQKALFNILCAYSVYNSEVGYCQGMSQVAALLLMYLTEEDAFWALAQLMTHTRYGMHGFFIPGFPKLVRFQQHHDRVMQSMLPKLKRHFDKHGVDCGLYTLKWFFQCFLDRVPFELSLRLWDIFLLEGDRVLICGAYAILKIHQKQLLARKNMDEILNYIQVTIPTNFGVDNDKAIEDYKQCSEDLIRKKLSTGGEPGDEELPKKPFGFNTFADKVIPPVKTNGIPHKTPIPKVAPSEREPTPTEAHEDMDEEFELQESNTANPKQTEVQTETMEISAEEELAVHKLLEEFESFELNSANANHSSANSSHRSHTSSHSHNLSQLPTFKKKSPSPPPPPPRSPSNVHDSRTASPSVHNHASVASQDNLIDPSRARKRVPPPVNPRRLLTSGTPTTVSESNLPNVSSSEAVRIHVPYSIPSSTHQTHPSQMSPRNGYDISKNDPNRIIIDVPSHSALIQ